MPLRNRVTPAGELIATVHRGTLMGNRGVLHDERRTVRRHHQHRRWITCLLSFRGRHRVVMTPRRYTELFFLDEAVSLAAGHRPCAECRRADYNEFRRHWATGAGSAQPPGADQLDAALHPERATTGGTRRTYPAAAGELPGGVFVVADGEPWLVHDRELRLWTPAGYTARRPLPGGRLDVLTPRSVVAAIARGYRPGVHPSAGTASDRPNRTGTPGE